MLITDRVGQRLRPTLVTDLEASLLTFNPLQGVENSKKTDDPTEDDAPVEEERVETPRPKSKLELNEPEEVEEEIEEVEEQEPEVEAEVVVKPPSEPVSRKRKPRKE